MNILPSIWGYAGMEIETILRDCEIFVGTAPNISFWIAESFGLKIVLVLYFNVRLF
jgi:hypothetical protein